ncbi:MAG TPA: PAS domain S-box protein [Candidatus Sulfopaludibacter sp.]|nr:PAS domain S-box protein [Candidatus Sulfopaludibacter sp.]
MQNVSANARTTDVDADDARRFRRGKTQRELFDPLAAQRRRNAAPDHHKHLHDFEPVGYLTLDHPGVIREIDATGRQLLKRLDKSPSGLPFIQFVAEPDRQKFRDHLRLCRESNRRVSTELRLARRRGATVWLELISLSALPEGGDQAEFRCALLDVTTRKQAEQARQDDGIRLRGVANSLPALVWICDADKRCTYFNQRWLEFTGRRIDEQLAAGWTAGIHPRDRYRSWKSFRAFFNARAEFKMEYRRRRQDGEFRWVLDNGVPLFGPAREFRGYVGSCMDITEHKRMEEALAEARDQMEERVFQRGRDLEQANAKLLAEIQEHRLAELALRESEERLTDFFERSPLGLVWAGPEGRICRVNQAWIELAGRSRAECLKHRAGEFFTEPQAAADLLRCVRRGEVVRDLRLRIRRRDGDIRHCLVDADGLWEHGRLIYSRWYVRDITPRARLEREILLVAEREQRRIGRDLHDDLCQQLTGIEYLSQSLARRLSERSVVGPARAREIAGMVREAITRTRELARGLAPVQLESGSLMGGLRDLSRRTRKLWGIDCRFICPKPFLNRDDVLNVHLYRIAQEAVANAVKHGLAKRVTIRLTRDKNRLELAIEDNGAGMPACVRAGKGMGLHVMQHRANVIGGTLSVRRNRRGGTSVKCIVKNGSGVAPSNGEL